MKKFLNIFRKAFLLVSVPLVIAAVSAWLWLHGGRYIATENAYIKADITSVSSEISGKVIEVLPRDNQRVEQGQVLYRLAQQPHLIAKAQAEAALANIRREIESQKVEYTSTMIEVERAEIDLNYQQKELERLRKLLDRGVIPGEEYDEAFLTFQQSENSLKLKRQELAVARAELIDPAMPVENHPAYQQAQAELARAELTLSYTEIKAPIEGIAVNVAASVGENIIMGTSLVNLVDDSHLWIEANFKETDLTYMQPGQPVEITVDAFPDETWHGVVSSITPATGAEFALLPPQNSSGNWVKVVQRITVDIEFYDVANRPRLSAGMSAEVTIDTGHQRSLPFAH